MMILFVCSGNTCRSPLAVAAWRALDADERQQSKRRSGRHPEDCLGWQAGVRVGSAGLAAQAGAPASVQAAAAAHDWNADLSSHRARRLDERLAHEADFIYTMTQQQAAAVRARFGIAPEKVRVLGEYEIRSHRSPRAAGLRADAATADAATADAEKPGSGDNSQQEIATRAASSERDAENERLLRLLGGAECMNDSSRDIADPFGGSLEAYRSCAAQIRRAVAGLRAALRAELPHRR